MNLLAALGTSKLIHAKEAAAALADGWIVRPIGEVCCSEVEDIYVIRRNHLLTKPGPHAQQLANSVDKLLAGLCEHAGSTGQWIEIRGDAEHHFILFAVVERVIGCMRVVSQHDVSDARWQELWQGVA